MIFKLCWNSTRDSCSFRRLGGVPEKGSLKAACGTSYRYLQIRQKHVSSRSGARRRYMYIHEWLRNLSLVYFSCWGNQQRLVRACFWYCFWWVSYLFYGLKGHGGFKKKSTAPNGAFLCTVHSTVCFLLYNTVQYHKWPRGVMNWGLQSYSGVCGVCGVCFSEACPKPLP